MTLPCMDFDFRASDGLATNPRSAVSCYTSSPCVLVPDAVPESTMLREGDAAETQGAPEWSEGACLSQAACERRAREEGLRLGGGGHPFSSADQHLAWNATSRAYAPGCHAYSSSGG